MRSERLKKLLVSLVACFGAAAIGGWFTGPSVAGWYATVQKPSFTPPNEVFAPVWSVLYFLMALALYSIWRKQDEGLRYNRALTFFVMQLLMNVAWSVVFFGLHSIAGGMVVIVALWVMIALTIYTSWRVSRFAAACLAPYLAWVSFAAFLNYAIWRLNP